MAIREDQVQQPIQPEKVVKSAALSPSSLKTQYMDVIQRQVVDPLRQDLRQMETQIRSDLSQLGSGDRDQNVARAGFEHELHRISKMEKVLDWELDRLRRLRLADADAGGGAQRGL